MNINYIVKIISLLFKINRDLNYYEKLIIPKIKTNQNKSKIIIIQ